LRGQRAGPAACGLFPGGAGAQESEVKPSLVPYRAQSCVMIPGSAGRVSPDGGDTGVALKGRTAGMGELGFPQAFADALSRRGVSLAWLQTRLVERGHPVSPAALSYWRSGRSQPERGTSRDALAEIERLLRVPPGHLVDRLGPSRRPGPRPGEKSTRELFDASPGIRDALRALGFEGLYDELVESVRHITFDVDADGGA